KAEDDYLKRQQEREKRRARIAAGQQKPENSVQVTNEGVVVERDENPRDNPGDAMNMDGLLKQTRQPEFVSSAYFLRFRFEEGKSALVGREQVDGGDTLRIEYYPSKLFRGTDRRRDRNGSSDEDKAYDEAFRHMMNKVALVTLWVEPKAHQI